MAALPPSRRSIDGHGEVLEEVDAFGAVDIVLIVQQELGAVSAVTRRWPPTIRSSGRSIGPVNSRKRTRV